MDLFFDLAPITSGFYLALKCVQYGLFWRLVNKGKSSLHGLFIKEGVVNKEISEVEVVPDTKKQKEVKNFHLKIKNDTYVTLNFPSFNFDHLPYTSYRKKILELYSNNGTNISGWNGTTDLIFNPMAVCGCGSHKTAICMPNTRLDDEKANDILGDLVNPAILSNNHVIQRTVPTKTNVIAVGVFDKGIPKLLTRFIGREDMVIKQIQNNYYYLRKGRIGFAAAILLTSTIGSFFFNRKTRYKVKL